MDTADLLRTDDNMEGQQSMSLYDDDGYFLGDDDNVDDDDQNNKEFDKDTSNTNSISDVTDLEDDNRSTCSSDDSDSLSVSDASVYDGGFNSESFIDLSTTLKEIDDTLNEDHAEQLNGRINASSDFLRQLLIKQKTSHRKIQEMQENVQKHNVQVEMVESERLHSSSISTEYDVSLSQYFQAPIQQQYIPNNQDDVAGDGLSVNDVSIDGIQNNSLVTLTNNETINETREHLNVGENNGKENNFGDEKVLDSTKYNANRRQPVDKENAEEEVVVESQEDSLMLFFDYMAAHIKEQRLEQERIKLNVIVALRTKLQDLYEGESIEKVPKKLLEKLNDNIYEILCTEVQKVKLEEEEKQRKQKQYFEEQIQNITSELEIYAREKCEAHIQLKSLREQLTRHKQNVEKSDHILNRNEYLENLLRSVETENEDLKNKTKELRHDNETLRSKLKYNQDELAVSKQKCQSLTTAEEVIKTRYEEEIQKLVEQNKQANDQVFTLQNGLRDVSTERDRTQNSKDTDLAIIRHLEENISKLNSMVESSNRDSQLKIEKSLKAETKANEYKLKLKKCVHALDMSRERTEKLVETLKSVEKERDDLRRSKNEMKLQQSDLQIKHVHERTDLEEKCNKLQVEMKLLKEKSLNKERANQYLRKQVEMLKSSSPIELSEAGLMGPGRSPSPIKSFSDKTKNPDLCSNTVRFNFDDKIQDHTMFSTEERILQPKNSNSKIDKIISSSRNSTKSSPVIGTRRGNRENSPPKSNPTPIIDKINYSSQNTKFLPNALRRSKGNGCTLKTLTSKFRSFLQEMSHKLAHSEIALQHAKEEFTSPLHESHKLKHQVDKIRSQVMDLSH